MIVLVGSAHGRQMKHLVSKRDDIGILVSPKSWKAPYCRHWACDNDVYAHRQNPAWWCREGEARWLKMLDKLPRYHPPLWVLLPDVVADWRETLRRAAHYRHELVSRGLPVAIALQDGCDDYSEALAIRPDCVFVGGSTEWKWAHAEEICHYFKSHGIRVHIGRAGGRLRIRACLRMGAFSCDGSAWAQFFNEKIPILLSELDQTRMVL